MKYIQNMKFAASVVPQSLNGATGTATAIDTLGFSYAALVMHIGATTADMTALSWGSCETTGGTYVAISGANFATSPAALPLSTDDNGFFVVFVNLQGLGRYIKPIATAGAAATLLTCFAILSEANQCPDTVTERGVVQNLFV